MLKVSTLRSGTLAKYAVSFFKPTDTIYNTASQFRVQTGEQKMMYGFVVYKYIFNFNV